MDFNLTDEQQMLRESASRFVREQYGFEARQRWAADGGWSPASWKQYAELGWLGLAIPEEAGGLGCGFVETALVAEELGRGMVLEPYAGCAVLAARLIERGDAPGFAAQREALLAGIAEGSAIVLLAHAEPESRFEIDWVGARARRHGDGWLLEGSKLLVAGAPAATHFIVSARIDREGIALFVVPREAVDLQVYPLIDGTQAADLTLREQVLPAGALLAQPGRAEALLEEAQDRAALAEVAEGLGCMEAVLDLASEYLKTRQQFGQPIGRFQALQHRMAEMFVEVQETRSILYRGIAHLDAAPAARRIAVSAAKVMLGSAACFVGGQGIQLHGGIGMTDEYQVGHYYKRLLTLEKMYGDSDWHLDRMVRAQREAA
jgi:alkylation response protein AidB-like acyl-CoA dehydrogenase